MKINIEPNRAAAIGFGITVTVLLLLAQTNMNGKK